MRVRLSLCVWSSNEESHGTLTELKLNFVCSCVTDMWTWSVSNNSLIQYLHICTQHSFFFPWSTYNTYLGLIQMLFVPYKRLDNTNTRGLCDDNGNDGENSIKFGIFDHVLCRHGCFKAFGCSGITSFWRILVLYADTCSTFPKHFISISSHFSVKRMILSLLALSLPVYFALLHVFRGSGSIWHLYYFSGIWCEGIWEIQLMTNWKFFFYYHLPSVCGVSCYGKCDIDILTWWYWIRWKSEYLVFH